MSTIRIVGIVVLVVGVLLIFFGMQQAESPADQITETFTGRFTQGTMWYLIGGVAAVVGGGLMALVGPR